jgi:hypothetical protein
MTVPCCPVDDPCPDHGESSFAGRYAAAQDEHGNRMGVPAGFAASRTSPKRTCRPDNRRRAAGIPDKTRRPAQSTETRRKG